VRRTRTVTKTEWRSLSGERAEYVTDRVVTASRGLPNRDLEAIEPFDLRALGRYEPALLSGWLAEEPSLSASACRRCACAIEAGDLRCAVCGLSIPEEQRLEEVPLASILRCESCGAAVRYDVEVQAPRCAFCGSVAHVERPTDPIEQPRYILPFRVTPDEAQAVLRGWLSSLGFFRPDDLATEASIATLQPLWWVAWVFDARALVSWTADSNQGAGRSAWAPFSGQTRMDFERILVPATRGLTDEECDKLTRHFDLSSARESLDGPPGVLCEGFQVQRSAARHTIARAIESVARARIPAHIPGRRYRKAKLAVLLEGLETHRCAMPTYVFAYRYRGKLYRALVHGQQRGCTFGEAPYSMLKIMMVALGIGVAGLALLLFVVAVLALSAQ